MLVARGARQGVNGGYAVAWKAACGDPVAPLRGSP
jgi:hypothetical protein